MVREWRLGDGEGTSRTAVRGNPAQAAVAWIAGGFVTLGAVALASVLALVFAATLAFVLVVAACALTFMAVVWRIRRPHAVEAGPVIEARKIGHSWVAYGWDQPS